MTKRLPLNEQIIVFYWEGVNSGLFGKGEYVPLISIRDECKRVDCPYTNEHLIFDGQIFYKKKEKL